MGSLADQLLRMDQSRADMLRDLETKQTLAFDAMDEYRAAWRAATGVGWAKGDLVCVGFLDPQRLPRTAQTKRRTRTSRRDTPQDQDTGL